MRVLALIDHSISCSVELIRKADIVAWVVREEVKALFGIDYFKGAFIGIQILWNATVERICY
jgi:hypothetical protein